MTPEQMERAIEFLLNSQAQNAADIGKLTSDVQGLKEVQAQTSRDVMTLASAVSELANTVARAETQMTEGFTRMEARMDRFEAQAESDRQEIREAIENLIVANEVTRDLAEKVTKLEIQTSQRVTDMDQRVTNLESKERP
ncbi:MAG: hypothetical protein AB1631_02660 [Acidobacteriota bacterium]